MRTRPLSLLCCLLPAVLIAGLTGQVSAEGTAASQFRLNADDWKRLTFRTDTHTPDEYARHILAGLRKLYPSIQASDPGVEQLLWSTSHWTWRQDDGQCEISEKYFGFAASNFNDYQKLREGLEQTDYPEAFQREILRDFARRVVRNRAPGISSIGVLRRVRDWPAGTVAKVSDHAGLVAALERAYPGWGELSEMEQAKRLTAVATVNPALRPVGWYGARPGHVDEDWPHAVVPQEDGTVRVQLYRVHADAAILLPQADWLTARAKEAELLTSTPPAKPAEPEVWELSFDRGGPFDAPFAMTVILRDGQIDNAYVTAPTVMNWAGLVAPVDPSVRVPDTVAPGKPTWLSLTGSSFGGRCLVAFHDRAETGPMSLRVVSIDARRDSGKIEGTFATQMPQDKGDPMAAKGKVTGQRVQMEPTAGADLAEGTDWPRWMGPHANGSANSCGEPVVDHLAKARLRWVSDATIPMGRGPDLRGKPKRSPLGMPLMGGAASPVVTDGKVYVSYWQPAGDSYAYRAQDLAARNNESLELYRVNRVNADDVLHCFDARTGQTLWKRVHPKHGLNWVAFNKGVPALTPCVDGGRVFHIGSTGKVYCTDAKTGLPLWESSLGERNEWMEDIKRYMVASGNPFSSRSDFVSNPSVAEGVLVACDHLRAKVDYRYERNNGLIGLDARTGKRLWHVPQCSSNGPVLWRHAGRTYVLGFARKGGATCIDPRTGKVLWREPGARRGHTNVAISGDVLVCDGLPEESDQRHPWAPIRAYRLSPKGAELVWELPKPIGNSTGGPTIYDGKAYIHAKQPESTMLCVDLGTGKILAKTRRPYGDNGEHDNAFFVSVDGRLMGSMDRGSYAWGPTDPKQFGQDKPWHAPTAVGYVSTIMPAVADGRIFFRTSNRLICWDVRQRFAVAARPDRPAPKPRKTDDDSEATEDDPKRPPSGKDGKGGKSDKPGKPGKPAGPDLEGMLEDDGLPDPFDSLD